MRAVQYPVWLLPVLSISTLLSAHPVDVDSAIRSSQHAYKFLPDLPSARQEHSVTILGDELYIIGGITSNYSYTPETLDQPSIPSTVDLVQRFNTKTDEWSDAAPLPVSINHGNVATIDGKIYLLGGLLGLNFSLWDGTANSYVYNPDSNTWTDLAPVPDDTARGACAVGVRGSDIYLAGGMRSLEISADGLQAYTNLVSSYNTETNTWNTSYPPLPLARDHVAGGIIGSRFYVTGGRDHGQYNVGNGETWSLDLDDPSAGWEILAPIPTPRGGLASAVVGHCLYTFGGEGNRADVHGVFDNVEVYDARQNTWKKLEPLWAGIHGTNAAVGGIDGLIHIPGGGYQISAGATNTSVAYHPSKACLDWEVWE